ncbi:MAG: 5'-nucleotidase C-terminal domain-containing protein [Gemmatimonadaceae bacterium]|nr:5'-nucleotidase C-terminal domain-containing protein [Gemmatimonadaceae bacterium]
MRQRLMWSAAGALLLALPTRMPAQGTVVDLVIAATTDVHGRLRGYDYFTGRDDARRGLARAATIVDSVRSANPDRVILVDAGDLLQGNPLTYVAARRDTAGPHPVIAAMNAMRYDAAALGNHEFNYGLPTLERALASASFPFLAANARRADGSRFLPAYRIVERGGVRVGILGATNPGSMVWDRDLLRGRVTIGDIVTSLKAAAIEAREAGADILIVVVHAGLDGASTYDTTNVASENPSARIAMDVPGIDLVVYGHSHREMADTSIGGVLLVQAKNFGESVALARLTVQNRGQRWSVIAKRGVLVRSAGHAESPAVVAATARGHAAAIAYANTVVGRTESAWNADSARVGATALMNFILEVERKVTGADLASTAAFDLGAALPAGPITVAQMAKLYPYDNTLRAIRITGAQLKQYLEQSARYWEVRGDTVRPDPNIPGFNFDMVAGADYEIDLRRPVGDRVVGLRVRGKAVRPTDTFTMALNNYRAGGGGGYGFIATAPVLYDQQREIRDLLIEEAQRRGVLRPADFGARNWRLTPGSLAAAAYASTRRDGGPR